ncbi:MAG: hypothetical protein ACPL4K_06810 [Candidatus Margulisiibacteriota bacterium]
MQGGIKPEPGKVYVIDNVPWEEIKKAYGYVPRAIAFTGGTIEFRESAPGYYTVTIYC